MSEDQLPPHDEPAEWFLLASAVHKPSIIPAIGSELFYIENARRVLLKMQQAWIAKLDCLKSPELFEHWLSKALESHCFEPLINAVTDLPSSENWIYWKGQLADAYKARRLEQLKSKISDMSDRVARGETPNEVLLEISKIAKLWQAARGESMKSLEPKVLEELDGIWTGNKFVGAMTGYPQFDNVTGGLQNNRLYVIGARPGVGKSSFAMNLLVQAAFRGTKGYLVSLEMSATEIGRRIFACESRVSEQTFREKKATDQDFKLVTAAGQRLRDLPFIIDDFSRSLSDIVMVCHQAVAEGAQLLVIDYLQKIVIPKFRHNRNELVTEISGAMKDIAMSLRVPVICCAQLNRESEKDQREPTLADLRDSGSVEQDADFVGLLHEVIQKDKEPHTDLIIGKNRGGQRGRIAFEFRKPIFRFDEELETP